MHQRGIYLCVLVSYEFAVQTLSSLGFIDSFKFLNRASDTGYVFNFNLLDLKYIQVGTEFIDSQATITKPIKPPSLTDHVP